MTVDGLDGIVPGINADVNHGLCPHHGEELEDYSSRKVKSRGGGGFKADKLPARGVARVLRGWSCRQL